MNNTKATLLMNLMTNDVPVAASLTFLCAVKRKIIVHTFFGEIVFMNERLDDNKYKFIWKFILQSSLQIKCYYQTLLCLLSLG